MHYYLTWGQFALLLTAALAVYYLIIFHKEIAALFNTPERPLQKASPENVMGLVREDEAEMNLVSSDELEFAPDEEFIAPPADKSKTLLLGGLADFMQELKTLIRITIEAEDTKENFLSLFRLVASRYSQLLDGSFNQSIISYVLDSDLPINLSQNELKQTLNDLNHEE
ncbi:hypothetical protein [Mucilaginibacter sp. dw_454]|uniref:hypothetical protein n=1 Tax=Mucilaginibacter sp. dw_454 TaxID=2720079 RepID=UPI001BD28D90|nr:hypothetical protein [Mucilaginibacter sp. dw_454]